MKKMMYPMFVFMLMHNQVAVSADQVLQRVFTFLNDRIVQKEVMQDDKKVDNTERNIKPVTDMAMHMAKGALIATGSCVPLLLAGLYRPDQMMLLDDEFKAGALSMPVVPWIIKDLIAAGNATVLKCTKNSSCRWQDVANAYAQVSGSLGSAVLMLMVMRYNQE